MILLCITILLTAFTLSRMIVRALGI